MPAPSGTTDQLALRYPIKADDVDPPRDIQALAEDVEGVLLDGVVPVGTTIHNVRSTHFDRWLMLDGTDRTQAEVETALGLDAGQGAAFAALMGTGGTSMFGAAATGKIKIPDARSRMLLAAGAGSGLTSRATGDAGGAESVTLSAAQSGLPAHTHTATQAAHGHTVTDPGHAHGASQAAHSHATSVADHSAHGHAISASNASNTQTTGGADRDINLTDIFSTGLFGADLGTTDSDYDDPAARTGTNHRKHTVTNPTATPAVTVSSATTGVSLATATPVITVNSVSSAPASNSHENMPPFLAVGHAFIRV